MASMLWEEEVVTLAKVAVADGTSEVTTAVEDMQNYDEVEWTVAHGDVDTAAVMTYTVKENSASSVSSPTPTAVTLTGAAGTGATISSGSGTITESSGNLDNKLIRVNVAHQTLTKRYAFLSITCATESHEVLAITCRKRRSRAVPVTQSSDVAAVFYAGN